MSAHSQACLQDLREFPARGGIRNAELGSTEFLDHSLMHLAAYYKLVFSYMEHV